MIRGSDEERDQCVRELLFYKGKLAGRTDDGSYHYDLLIFQVE